MKKLLLGIALIMTSFINAQTVMSWNIQYLGESKFKKDTIIPVIIDVMKKSEADIIAIQELVTNKYGDSCIIQIADELNYNYIISNKTTGKGTERYAYLWNKMYKLNYAHLDTTLESTINREPYIANFSYKCNLSNNFTIRQIHTIPSSKNPAKEIIQLKKYHDGIICGDFNLHTKNMLYINFLSQFTMPLAGVPTTLTRNNQPINPYDAFIVSKNITIKGAFVFNYDYKYNRNKISDHLPIIINISNN